MSSLFLSYFYAYFIESGIMIHVEGRKCTKHRVIRVVNKRSVQLSLYLGQQIASKRIETVRRSEQVASSAFDCIKTFDRTVKPDTYTPESKSIPLTPKTLSKTLTPVWKRSKHLTALSVEFKLPADNNYMKVNRAIFKNNVSTAKSINRSIWVSSAMDSPTRSRRIGLQLENRITMKDLQVTLPDVIKQKKHSRKSHRFSYFL